MDFYQQLQLSSIGSKQWIKGAKDSKEKHKRILIYNFKVYLVVAFCFAVVTLYSMIFGSQNSVVGVLVLLVLMILRQVDFGIDTKHSIGVIFMIFAILAVGPRQKKYFEVGSCSNLGDAQARRLKIRVKIGRASCRERV